MDFGSGPGTALWSATEVWPELDNILAVEPSEAMIDVAHELCKGRGPVLQQQRLAAGVTAR
jgi:ribosomal protein RSM22 (predicted rRNA methylase)